MKQSDFAKKIESVGAVGYKVGGAMRDEIYYRINDLPSQKPKDTDYMVTNLTTEEFQKLFPEAFLKGNSFPVFQMEIDGEQCEIALAREEKKVGAGHTGFEVISSKEITAKQDASRRDFTINQIFENIHTGELVDYYGGVDDLKIGIIRKVTDAFREDPLRVYRAARFAAQFGFEISEDTLADMNYLKSELSTLSIERVIEETKKALSTKQPSAFFRSLKRAGVLDVHFPEIDCLSEFEQSEEYHPEGDVFEHTMQVGDAAAYYAKHMPLIPGESAKSRKDREQRVVFTAFVHDVGKVVTQGIHPTKGTFTYRRHEFEGVAIAKKMIERFNLVSWEKGVLFGVEYHMIMHNDIGIMSPAKVVDFVEGKFQREGSKGSFNYWRKPGIRNTIGIDEYIALCSADDAGRCKNRKDLAERVKVPHYNKEWLEEYAKRSKDIRTMLDIEELKISLDGPELGYAIHEDVRKQRTQIVRDVRK